MKNLFNKKDAAIDLTSLLDVIFIVLLVVMCSQKVNADEAKISIEEAKEVTEEATQIVDRYKQHMDKYEEIGEYVLFIDVTATFDPATVTERHISVFSGADDSELMSWDVTPQNQADIYKVFEQYIESLIDQYIYSSTDGVIRPVILSVNKGDDNILYRDEQAITTVFDNILNKDKYNDKNFIYVR